MPRTSKETFSRKKYFVWTADSTECLLEMWMENLSDFYGRRKNSHIMREMAESMKDYGLSMLEIKAKMDNMKKKYRKEFQILSLSGSKRSNWEYFSQMRHIMEYNDDEFESDEESMPKSSHNKSSPVKKESPKGNQSENEYSDSSFEFEFPEPDVNRKNSKRPHDEVYDDSDEEEPSINLHLESSLSDENTTESIHSENESERSIEFVFPELNAKRYKHKRAKAMGEEMLALQRETLNVMRTMAKDLSSFHDKFLKALKPTHHKRSS
ncbi:DNA topoisomerase 1-like [Drosophila rhopaloa]|uniref:DNA topoisomerase 1-like n=1 Tax=Drosophila rhopaloa TaxID=1041015 RepID=A0A6P4E7D7_DRORH|nr:DNA topoisomerase 1-like [Drosophila rhopaloa]